LQFPSFIVVSFEYGVGIKISRPNFVVILGRLLKRISNLGDSCGCTPPYLDKNLSPLDPCPSTIDP
jgi:hypothetical protein